MVTAPSVGTGPRYGAVPVWAREAHLSKPRACGEPSHSVCSFWLKSIRCDYLGVKRVQRHSRGAELTELFRQVMMMIMQM